MLKQYFYIIGLPRSRTAWLSQFFTTEYSECNHDLFSSYFVHGASILQGQYKQYTGSADTNPESWAGIRKPKGPTVKVIRHIDDVKISMMEAFKTPAGFTAEAWVNALDRLLDRYQTCLFDINADLTINYDDLNDLDVVNHLWKTCIPSIGATPYRVASMMDLNITVKHDDLTDTLRAYAKNRNISYDNFCENLKQGER